MRQAEYVAIFSEAEDGWTATVPDLPGCVSCGDTYEDAKSKIQDAINGMIECMIEEGVTPPKPNHFASMIVARTA